MPELTPGIEQPFWTPNGPDAQKVKQEGSPCLSPAGAANKAGNYTGEVECEVSGSVVNVNCGMCTANCLNRA